MEWRDTGFVLAARRHGESALIVELLTAEHGRHAGLVRGGQSPRRRALFQPGNGLAVHWRGRLPEHLGAFECELLEAHAASLLDDADRLAALNSATALLMASLPEREPHADLHTALGTLLRALTAPIQPSSVGGGGLGWGHDRGPIGDAPAAWAAIYVAWECALLTGLGFGLDLACCAATGVTHDLAYVSPRTGRAVSRDAGAPYHDKLLLLPAFLWRPAPAEPADIVSGLALTWHFLLHHLLLPQGGKLPEARERLADRMRRHAASGMVAGN